MMDAVRGARRWLATVLGNRTLLALTRGYDALGRLSYILDSDGRRSAGAIKSLRGIGQGTRCFVIGNGPSLAGMELSALRGEVTFGLNRAYLLFEKIGFATTYLVAVNKLVIEQAADEILAINVPTFMSWHARKPVSDRSQPIFLPTSHAREFSFDPAKAIWEGATVTFVALQLAHWMGYDPVILIGVDHSFTTKGPPHRQVTSSGADPNHFDPGYFGKGFRWNLPDLGTSEVAYEMARDAFESTGRTVLDATVGGKLQVFKKAEFDSLFPRVDTQ